MARSGGLVATYTITGSVTNANILTEIYSDPAHYNRGCTFYIHSSVGSTTIKIWYVDTDDVARELASKALSADDFWVVDFDYPLPESKVTITTTSGSGTVKVEALVY